jgi:hypothetical protein
MLPDVLAEALEILNANGACVEVRRAFLPADAAARWLARLRGELAFDPPEASRVRQPFTGRMVDVPRLQGAWEREAAFSAAALFYGASVAGRVATGRRAGQRVVRVGDCIGRS